MITSKVGRPFDWNVGEESVPMPGKTHTNLLYSADNVEYKGPDLIHQLFEEQVYRTPDTIALTFESTMLSYRELNEKSNQLAFYLRDVIATPEPIIAIYLERSIDMVVALFATLKAGGAYVPIDPNLPRLRIGQMLEDSKVKIVITIGKLKEDLPKFDGSIIALDEIKEKISKKKIDNLIACEIGLNSKSLAYVIFTSGSTGRAKGAMNEHRGVVNRLKWMQATYPLNESDSLIQKTPFSFDVSVWEFFWPLFTGARLTISRPGGHKDPHYLNELINKEKVTVIHFVPSMLKIYLDYLKLKKPPSLKRVFCSGEELSVILKDRFLNQLKDVQLHNLYGPTEAAIDVSSWDCSVVEKQTHVPIGRPISNVSIYILDSSLEIVQIGMVGEIYIGGLAVGRGYINNEKLTSEFFIPDPFGNDGMMIYRTGDIGRWAGDGNVEYLGRNDNQLKIRGLRIEPGEIEEYLIKFSSVKDAAVMVMDDFENKKKLIAYLILNNDHQEMKEEELREYLSEYLPDYMIPNYFMTLPSFPLTNNGKLDRKNFPFPDFSISGLEENFVEAETKMEILIAKMWVDILNVHRIGVHDNFFALGGDSLNCLEFEIALSGYCGYAPGYGSVYLNPTVETYSLFVEKNIKERKKIESIPAFSLTPNQSANLEFDPQSYTSLVTEINIDINSKKLEEILCLILNKHSAFQQCFYINNVSHHESEWNDKKLSIDMGFSSNVDSCDLNSVIHSLNKIPFNLESPPLVKATYLKFQSEVYLHLKISHLISDGWSLGIILTELNAMCSGDMMLKKYEERETEQFRDYLKESSLILSNKNQDELKKYWKKRLDQRYEFPKYFNKSRDEVDTSLCFDTCGQKQSDISVPIRQAVKLWAKKWSMSEYSLYLAAYGLMIAAASRTKKFIVMTIDNGRPSQFLNAIGYFMNVMPISMELNGNENFKSFSSQTWLELVNARVNSPLANGELYSLLGPPPSNKYSSPCNAFFQIHDYGVRSNFISESMPLRPLPEFSVPDSLSEDLGLDIYWSEDGELCCYWSYCQCVFTEYQISLLIDSYSTVLLELTISSSAEISDLLENLFDEKVFE